MKTCPVCDARYDEEIIRFCTKDGTPLIDEKQPSFTAMPSEAAEDDEGEIGQETIVRRKPLVPPDQPLAFDEQGRSERIVIPTQHAEPPPPNGPNVRARSAQGYNVPPPPPNTAKTVVLTVLGTLAVLGVGVAIVWFLRKDTPSNINVNLNANQNLNLNSNVGFDSNFNFNLNSNFNANSNANFNANLGVNINTNTNANTTRPSPTPSPRLSPSPSPDDPSPTPANTATPRPTVSPRPSVTPRPTNTQPAPVGTPRIGPRPPPINRPGNANN